MASTVVCSSSVLVLILCLSLTLLTSPARKKERIMQKANLLYQLKINPSPLLSCSLASAPTQQQRLVALPLTGGYFSVVFSWGRSHQLLEARRAPDQGGSSQRWGCGGEGGAMESTGAEVGLASGQSRAASVFLPT